MAETRDAISPDIWASRRQELCEIIELGRQRSNSKYDCVIPVSGGKDSYFQVHVIKRELGFQSVVGDLSREQLHAERLAKFGAYAASIRR